MTEQALIVHFDYGLAELDTLFELEARLEEAISEAGVGDYDGNEVSVSGSDVFLYMYGPDADALLAVVRPILANATSVRNAVATLRYGPPADDTRQLEVPIEP